MEVKIGVQHAARELVVDTNEDADQLEQRLEAAVAEGAVFTLTDQRGRKVIIPVRGIAYVELGGSHGGQVGFRS